MRRVSATSGQRVKAEPGERGIGAWVLPYGPARLVLAGHITAKDVDRGGSIQNEAPQAQLADFA